MFKFLGRSAERKGPKKVLQKVLGEYSLPSFSTVVLDTLEKLRDPEVSPAMIGETLSADPGLSVRVLSTVNSAAYALRREVRSVEHAVALLGIPTVESLVLSAAVGDAIPSQNQPGYENERFWRAATRRAATARALAGVLHPASASESFTAGLLQDMAVPFLAAALSDKYGSILEAWHTGSDSLADLEQQEFGWDHAEIGAWLGLNWNLPESLATAIGQHHLSQDTEGLACAPAVHLVSLIGETEENLGLEQLVETAHEVYGVPLEELDRLIKTSFEYAEELIGNFVNS